MKYNKSYVRLSLWCQTNIANHSNNTQQIYKHTLVQNIFRKTTNILLRIPLPRVVGVWWITPFDVYGRKCSIYCFLPFVPCWQNFVSVLLSEKCSDYCWPSRALSEPGLSSTGAGFHTGGWRLVAPRSSISLGAIANLNTTQDSNSPVWKLALGLCNYHWKLLTRAISQNPRSWCYNMNGCPSTVWYPSPGNFHFFLGGTGTGIGKIWYRK